CARYGGAYYYPLDSW
nr:immunoglobulin heavy chain junction region [Macaca mulatta]MOY22400.1 immunoglobulin heavy chain junction region [Macaca mulatta]MOY22554.1 immunoglobulin heavy chain junction region [Macaca mulatta]MOY22948.1 immunoglobulin heavy chain junction region [Macaca mulatta]MOY24312.1 immunoglobulin heavy chain junction region [Macaca mulatta]